MYLNIHLAANIIVLGQSLKGQRILTIVLLITDFGNDDNQVKAISVLLTISLILKFMPSGPTSSKKNAILVLVELTSFIVVVP